MVLHDLTTIISSISIDILENSCFCKQPTLNAKPWIASPSSISFSPYVSFVPGDDRSIDPAAAVHPSFGPPEQQHPRPHSSWLQKLYATALYNVHVHVHTVAAWTTETCTQSRAWPHDNDFLVGQRPKFFFFFFLHIPSSSPHHPVSTESSPSFWFENDRFPRAKPPRIRPFLLLLLLPPPRNSEISLSRQPASLRSLCLHSLGSFTRPVQHPRG